MNAASPGFDPVWLLVGFSGIVAVIALGTVFVQFGKWVGAVNTDRTNFQAFMDEIRADVRAIREDIGKIFSRMPSTTAVSASPRRLTSLGRKISVLLKAGDVVARMAEDLRPQTAGKSNYEIQVFAQKHIDAWSPEGALESAIQQCAFDHGIPRADVMEVFAIELRDALLPPDSGAQADSGA